MNSSGTTVVAYTYDAWGNPLTVTETLASTLGTLNPLRYRGYVYDIESGLYYLQSRYYNPEIGRFINSDTYASTGQGLLGNNMFAYCLNNPTNYYDSTGKDAVWVHESDNAGGMGHAGLLVQDENGEWYFFYWGPMDKRADKLILGTDVDLIYKKVDVGDEDLTTIEGVKNVLKNNGFSANAASTTDICYFKGDYSNTHQYLSSIDAESEEYTLLSDNCVKRTWKALGKSNDLFRDFPCGTIPDIAFRTAKKLNKRDILGAVFISILNESSLGGAIYALFN